MYTQMLHHSTNIPSKDYVKIRFIFYIVRPYTNKWILGKAEETKGTRNRKQKERGKRNPKYVSFLWLSFTPTIIVKMCSVYSLLTTSPSTLKFHKFKLKHKWDGDNSIHISIFISFNCERSKMRETSHTIYARTYTVQPYNTHEIHFSFHFDGHEQLVWI